MEGLGTPYLSSRHRPICDYASWGVFVRACDTYESPMSRFWNGCPGASLARPGTFFMMVATGWMKHVLSCHLGLVSDCKRFPLMVVVGGKWNAHARM